MTDAAGRRISSASGRADSKQRAACFSKRSSCLLAALFALACQRSPALWTEPQTGMTFVRIPAGEFTMGSLENEPGREPGEIQHRVRLSRPFYIGRYEITQAEWSAVMGDNPSRFTACGARCPVESVSALDVERFLERLNRTTSRRFRLPTEAEWEYACRAGTTTAYATGARLAPEQANIDQDDAQAAAPGSPVPVGSFPANPWGLFDLHGNVWEWTADRYCPYSNAATVDPVSTCDAELRVIRGGSWHFGADSARCALRYTHRPEDSGFSLGFRLVHPLELD